MLTVTRSCMQGLTFIGWGCHLVGLIMLIYSMVTRQWLYWSFENEYQGIFPCCPSFKCGRHVETGLRKDSTIDVVVGLIILGLVLVILGGIFSVILASCTWRKTSKNRTWCGLLYMTVVVIGTGALILLGAGLLFAVKVPSKIEKTLQDECTGYVFNLDTGIDLGLSFKTYLAAGIFFFLSTVFIFVGGPRRRTLLMQGVLMEEPDGVPHQIPLNNLMCSPQTPIGQQLQGTNISQPVQLPAYDGVVNCSTDQDLVHMEGVASFYEPPSYESVLSDRPPPYKERV